MAYLDPIVEKNNAAFVIDAADASVHLLTFAAVFIAR